MQRFLAVWLGLSILGAGLAIGYGFQQGRSQDRYVTVKGLAEHAVVADQGTWILRFQAMASTLNDATLAHQSAAKSVWNFVQAMGFDEAELQRGIPRVQEIAHHSQQNQVRYQINDDLRIQTKKVELLQELAGRSAELLNQGVVLAGWEEPQYYFTQLVEIKPKMIEIATQDARAAARKFADDVETDLGAIRRASQGYFSFHGENQGLAEVNQIRKVARVVVTIEFILND
ncbi:MAG: SIMPL domain-containing protein [Oligoflexus sp.]